VKWRVFSWAAGKTYKGEHGLDVCLRHGFLVRFDKEEAMSAGCVKDLLGDFGRGTGYVDHGYLGV
jgi:hypothetical protein